MHQNPHDYRICTIQDCQECQALVDAGIVMACDDCGTPGDADADGWELGEDGRVRCSHCAKQVSVSLPLSAYLAAILRAQRLVVVLKENAGERHKHKVPDDEKQVIRLFEEGLASDRLELHGSLASPSLGNILAHYMDLCDDDFKTFEAYFEDIYKFGNPGDVTLWRAITPAQLVEVHKEAVALGGFAGTLWQTIPPSGE